MTDNKKYAIQFYDLQFILKKFQGIFEDLFKIIVSIYYSTSICLYNILMG